MFTPTQEPEEPMIQSFVSAALLCAFAVFRIAARWNAPKESVDPATGHRVVRLSDESGTASLYFHQNPYTASGDKMVVTTRDGLATIDLRSRKIESIVAGRVSEVVVGRKTRQVFYMKDGTVYSTHLDTHTTPAISSRRWHDKQLWGVMCERKGLIARWFWCINISLFQRLSLRWKCGPHCVDLTAEGAYPQKHFKRHWNGCKRREKSGTWLRSQWNCGFRGAFVRSLDAIHLACALACQSRLNHKLPFVTADARQRDGARALGLDAIE